METIAYLGIDVSKGSADFLLVDSRKETLEEGFVLDDCTQGRKVLTQLIDGWFAGGSPICIAGGKHRRVRE
jgi:transposase